MNDITEPKSAASQSQKQRTPQSDSQRTPIPIEKLLITHSNPHGVKLPDGISGQSDRLCHSVVAGDMGDFRVVIEHLPWMRVFRVTKTRKVGDTWGPMGKPFTIPDVWAVSVPVDG